MTWLAQAARRLVLALQYFSRLPIPTRLAQWTGFDAQLQRESLAHFPGVGVVVGIVAGTCYAGVVMLLGVDTYTHLAAAVISTAIGAWFTGALHEDGAADTTDGFAAGGEREHILAAMKDSRLRSSGALAMIGTLLAKVLLLSMIGSAAGWAGAIAALVAAHTVSRGLALAIVATLSNIGREGSSKSLAMAHTIGRSGLAVAAIWCTAALVIAAMVVSPMFCVAGLMLSAATLIWLRRMYARRLQGYTGDCLGATQQLCEIAFYLGAALSL